MPIFTLVSDVEKIVETLRAQYGEFALAMLYNNELEAESSWNLIVSAPWTDGMGVGEATRTIARALNQGLGLENQRAISRITVLKTSDPFVRDMTRFYPARPGARIPIQQVTAGPISEGSGFILYSQMVA
jgi:hypothetical protein